MHVPINLRYVPLNVTFQNSAFCCNGVCVCDPYDSKDQYSYYRIGTFSEDGVSSLSGRNWISVHSWDETQTRKYFSVDKKNQLDVTFCILYFSSNSCSTCFGRPWTHYLPTGLQPSCSHGTYQHEAITSRSHQLLMMGTWLPETCWATIRRKMKNAKSDIWLVFLIHTELRCTVTHTSDLRKYL